MKNKMVILTSYDGFFGQQVAAWESLDTGVMREVFEAAGFDVSVARFNDVANGRTNISDSYVVYTGDPDREYYDYIEDVLLLLQKQNNILLPSFDIHRCHENKGYQEIYKRLVGIESLKAAYNGSISEADFQSYDLPCVVKLPRGAGSRHVFRCESLSQLRRRLAREDTLWRNHLWMYLKEKIKQFILPYRYVREYDRYFLTGDVRHVVQPMVPDLTCDYKVLVFGEKFYSLKRTVRRKDFRASGSGAFEQDSAYPDLLDFAQEIYSKLNMPVASLDICFDGSQHHLIEFQGIHFGPLTMTNSNGYFRLQGNEWQFVTEKPNLEQEYARAMVHFIKRTDDVENPDHQLAVSS